MFDKKHKLLAEWYLLTHVPESVDDATVALWHYWRWRIESYFKLLKSAGLQLEDWRQTTAERILRRLLIAAMACVAVWRLADAPSPEARALLVRLSGRQMKHKCPFTVPALLAVLWFCWRCSTHSTTTPLPTFATPPPSASQQELCRY